MEVDRNHSMSVWVDTTTPTASTGSVLVHLEKYLNVLEAGCCMRVVIFSLTKILSVAGDMVNPSQGERGHAWATQVYSSTE